MYARTHLEGPLRKLRKGHKAAWRVLVVAALVVSGFGLYQFVSRRIVDYLFLRTVFAFMDYVQPLSLFLLDYLAMMVLFGTIGVAVSSRLR